MGQELSCIDQQSKKDHDDVVVLKTRFEELKERVNENLLNRVHQREAAETLAQESEKKIAVLHSELAALNTRLLSEVLTLQARVTNEVSGLSNRISLAESGKGFDKWIIGGMGGAIIVLAGILVSHFLGA